MGLLVVRLALYLGLDTDRNQFHTQSAPDGNVRPRELKGQCVKKAAHVTNFGWRNVSSPAGPITNARHLAKPAV